MPAAPHGRPGGGPAPRITSTCRACRDEASVPGPLPCDGVIERGRTCPQNTQDREAPCSRIGAVPKDRWRRRRFVGRSRMQRRGAPARGERERPGEVGGARACKEFGHTSYPRVPTHARVMSQALSQSNLRSLPLLARGKVRDNYAVGDDRLLMVASDRLSAFDVVLGEPIPGKGEVLTRMALFWFDKLQAIVPNHLTGEDPVSVVEPDEAAQVRGRAMLVKRLQPLPVEAVVRGYLAGSGWKEYQERGTVCGLPLPPGLKLASRLSKPIFTPATKAEAGEHDENISFERMQTMIGTDLADRVRDVSIRLYEAAAAHALARGIIIADTKFEFGLDKAGTLTLMDEVLTPDSSRFWLAATYGEGRNPDSFDKQPVRDWLDSVQVDGQPWNKRAPAPPLPAAVAQASADRYAKACALLLGEAR
jgi:phosphoribosylaminoimidazole-succinocarboxamide synthase